MPDLHFDSELAKFTDRQIEALRHLDSGQIKFLLYGGALGGGKSYFLRWYGIRRLMHLAKFYGLKNCTAMLACEDYPSLKDRQLSKIPREFPPEIGRMHGDHAEYGRCFILAPEYGSGVLCFRNLDDPSKYQSSEWVLILVDELTKNPFETFTHLTTRLRWPGLPDVECQFIGGTNPGGVGHGWVKQFWMDKLFPVEWTSPVDYRTQFAYVPSRADDNPHLSDAYWQGLQRLPEALRKAFRDGNWDIFVGQAFPELSRETHAIKPIWPIPQYAPLYMTYDWGFGRPFSLGWWWADEMGRVLRFNRWYGCSGVPNEGLRMPDSEVAEGIVKKEVAMGLAALQDPEDLKTGQWERTILRYAGFDCFNKKPDYKGGGQGPTTAETFAKYGLHLIPMDSKREIKIRQFRERLRVQEDGLPMMLIYETDEEFFRTVPNLVMDENNVEDVDSDGEDHCFHGDTEIRTSTGIRKIREMVGTEGKVQTVDGSWVFYTNCKLTQKQVPVVGVIFSDKTQVICTPDHEFYTKSSGWKKAIDLTDELCYVSMKEETLCRSSLSVKPSKNLMGKNITVAVNIFKERVNDSIGRFGNFIMGLFQKGFMFIIKPMIEVRTTMKTWNYALETSTYLSMQNLTIIQTGHNPCSKGQQNGMGVRKVLNGISSSMKSIVGRLFGELSQKSVKSVEYNIKERNIQNIVHENVGMMPIYKEGLIENKESAHFVSKFLRRYGVQISDAVQGLAQQNSAGSDLRVIQVQPFGKADVYCLEVPSMHCFSLANGVIVSNCYDEACHIAMARPLNLETPIKKLAGAAKIIHHIERPPEESWDDRGIEGYADEPDMQDVGLEGYL